MKRILIGTVAMIMAMPAFADDPLGPLLPMGRYSCTVTYNCGDGTGASHSYTNSDSNNEVITVSENTTCSKSGTTFSHWAVTMDYGTPSSPVAYPGESYDTTGCSDDAGNNFVFTAVYTSDNARTTSKPYVDDQIATRQIKIPAANPSNTNYGERVITYTNVAGGGVIGERALFTGSANYNSSTDANKLITASALNERFTNLPTTDTTKLQCANQADGCTLWTIIDQTAYGDNSNSCKAYDETTTVESDCCSGRWAATMMDLNGNVSGGLCGCVTDSDCRANAYCDNMIGACLTRVAG